MGGDSLIVEKAYGAACNVKEIISFVLDEKITKGELNVKDALYIAKLIFQDNARIIYKL